MPRKQKLPPPTWEILVYARDTKQLVATESGFHREGAAQERALYLTAIGYKALVREE